MYLRGFDSAILFSRCVVRVVSYRCSLLLGPLICFLWVQVIWSGDTPRLILEVELKRVLHSLNRLLHSTTRVRGHRKKTTKAASCSRFSLQSAASSFSSTNLLKSWNNQAVKKCSSGGVLNSHKFLLGVVPFPLLCLLQLSPLLVVLRLPLFVLVEISLVQCCLEATFCQLRSLHC